MNATKEQLQERAQLVRIHEANCRIEYPTPEEANFRLAVMKALGLDLGLREIRSLTINGPAGKSAGSGAPLRVVPRGTQSKTE